MENLSAVPVLVIPKQNNTQPVFITFTPEYEKEHGLSRDIDKFSPKSLERTPQEDCLDKTNLSAVNSNICALKAPSSTEILKGMAVIPVILETGKQILIGIFDIRDIWNDRTSPKEHNLQAVIIPDEIADAVTNNSFNAEA